MVQTLGKMLDEALKEAEPVTRDNFEEVLEEIERKLQFMPQVNVYEEPIGGLSGWVKQENPDVTFYQENSYGVIETGGSIPMKVKPGSRYGRFRHGFVVQGFAGVNHSLHKAFSSR